MTISSLIVSREDEWTHISNEFLSEAVPVQVRVLTCSAQHEEDWSLKTRLGVKLELLPDNSQIAHHVCRK